MNEHGTRDPVRCLGDVISFQRKPKEPWWEYMTEDCPAVEVRYRYKPGEPVEWELRLFGHELTIDDFTPASKFGEHPFVTVVEDWIRDDWQERQH